MPQPGTNQITFQNPAGHTLAAKLEWPTKSAGPKAVALFAHCFTCTKDLPSITRISRALAAEGFAVLRFDFTGLGQSEGDFSHSNFTTNVADLAAAAHHLEQTVGAPSLLIGHSLGGAAAIAASAQLEGIRGIVTLGTPSDTSHLADLLAKEIEAAESVETGAAVTIGGLTYTMRRQLLDDLRSHEILPVLRDHFRGSLLVLHSPTDRTVDISHAGNLFAAARHPKSFISLAGADHLLSRPADSAFAAGMIAAWARHLFFD